MSFSRQFPTVYWPQRVLTGRIARRVYLSMALLLLLTSIGLRIYEYLLTRRMQAVLAGLSTLHIDQTSEQELARLVPYLERGKSEIKLKPSLDAGQVESGLERFYSVTISNEPIWMKFSSTIRALRICSRNAQLTHEGYERGCFSFVSDLLGFRYIYFSASVIVLNGKVSCIRYGVMDRLGFPRLPSEVLSVSSFHSFYGARQTGFEVRSTDDESPLFRVYGTEHHLTIAYAYDAPRGLSAPAFRISLNCFWRLTGCGDVNQISPELWEARNKILMATLARLQSRDPCPDRILSARVRYLPDAGVFLLQSMGYHQQFQGTANGILTRYKILRVLQEGPRWGLESVWAADTLPFPGDYDKRIPNLGITKTEAGSTVLAFSNLNFDTCALLPVTPSAVSAVSNVSRAPRRVEDQVVHGLM